MLQEPSQDGWPECRRRASARICEADAKERRMRRRRHRDQADAEHHAPPPGERFFRGPDGREIKRSILDTFTGNPIPQVNSTYPDNVPLTVPCSSSRACPRFPDALQHSLRGAEADPPRSLRAAGRRYCGEGVSVIAGSVRDPIRNLSPEPN
jgi:hypothetical protein